jgi:Transposase
MVDQHLCTDLHAFKACPSRLPGKRAWPVPRGRRRSNAPPLPDWRIWFFVLEGCGLAVQLDGAAQAKSLSGRPKTGKLDAMWLARLTEMGLLRASFVPPKAIRDLRDYTRMRTRLVQERTRCFQRPGKAAGVGPGQGLVRGQQADDPLGAGHDQGHARRAARPAGAGQPGPHRDEGQARGAGRGAGRHVR